MKLQRWSRGRGGVIKRHMEEEEESYLSRDGAGNSGLRNHLRRWRRAGREKQSQPKRASVERGYLPENETESTFVFRVSLLRSLGLKCCRSREREERKRRRMTMIRVCVCVGGGGCQQFTYVVISQKRLQHEK